MKDEDFEGFWRALPTMAVMANHPVLRPQFARQYKQEIVGLLGWLRRLGLAGGVTILHSDPPEWCGLCGEEIAASSFFVEGRSKGGQMVNMCGRCFFDEGEGVGPGIGLLYWSVGDGQWRLIAGDDPNVSEADYGDWRLMVGCESNASGSEDGN